MRWRAILSESWRTLLTGTSRALLWIPLLTLVVAGAAVADVVEAHGVTVAAREYVAHGGSVSVLSAPGRIDPRACEALARVPGVRAAGALTQTEERVILAALPAAPVPLVRVSPALPRLLGARTIPAPGLLASDQVREDVPVTPGGILPTLDGEVPVAGVFDQPEDGRSPSLGYALLAPDAGTDPFDQCWIDVWPQSEEIEHLVLTALTGVAPQGEAARVELRPLNPTLPARFDGRARFEERLSRFLPLVAGLVGLAVGAASVRMRRLELASNLHAGLRRGDLARIVALDTLAWLLPALVLAASIGAVTVAALGAQGEWALLVLVARPVWAAGVGTCLGAGIALALTRERHLFAWSKDR